MIPWNPWNWDIFLLVIVALLALSLLLLGILTAYFGSGKSRMIGVVLLVIGIVLAVIDIASPTYLFHLGYGWVPYIAIGTIFYVVAAIIGVVIGLLVFLGFIMKS